jgi:hypothetical protein
MKNLLFHIDHSSHPEYITEILQLLESGVKYDDIFDYGKNEGKFSSINTKKSFNNVLTNLKRLEIINKDNAWPKFGEILLKHLHDNDILSNLLQLEYVNENCTGKHCKVIEGILNNEQIIPEINEQILDQITKIVKPEKKDEKIIELPKKDIEKTLEEVIPEKKKSEKK